MAFITSVTFLHLNDWYFVTEPTEGDEFIEGLAFNKISEENFKSWLVRVSTEIL